MEMFCVAVVALVYVVEVVFSDTAVTNRCSYNGSVAVLSPFANESCSCVFTANNTLALYLDISTTGVQSGSAATCWPAVQVMRRYYMCAGKSATHSTMRFMKPKGQLELQLYSMRHSHATVTVTFSANTSVSSDYSIRCQLDSQWQSGKECPCPVTALTSKLSSTGRDTDIGTRLLIGFLSAFFFLCAFGGIWLCHRWYQSRRKRRYTAHLMQMPKLAKANMAFDGYTRSNGSKIYAEITDPKSSSFDILPDATLNLSLQTPSGSVDDGYKGSSESGLYNTAHDGVPRRGLQYIPDSSYATIRMDSPYATVKSESPYATADNFETISPYETAPAHTRRPHTPPQATLPLTAEEIDAMYAKPNKRKMLREKSGRALEALPGSGVLVSNDQYISLSTLHSPQSGHVYLNQNLETDI